MAEIPTICNQVQFYSPTLAPPYGGLQQPHGRGHAFSSPKPGEATIPSPLMSPPPKSRSPDPDSQFPRRPRVSPEPWASPARRSALQSAESTNVSHMHLPPELPPCISDLGLLPELRCGCGFAACKKISHTPRNPGREFLACGSKSQKWICKT